MSFLRTLLDNLPEGDVKDNVMGMTMAEVEELLERVLEKAKQQEKERLDNMVEMDEDLFKID